MLKGFERVELTSTTPYLKNDAYVDPSSSHSFKSGSTPTQDVNSSTLLDMISGKLLQSLSTYYVCLLDSLDNLVPKSYFTTIYGLDSFPLPSLHPPTKNGTCNHIFLQLFLTPLSLTPLHPIDIIPPFTHMVLPYPIYSPLVF